MTTFSLGIPQRHTRGVISLLRGCLLIVSFTFISAVFSDNAFAGEKAWLGVKVQQPTGRNMRVTHMLYGRGDVISVAEVLQGSPAEQMGIKLGDVILSVNYKDIKSAAEFADAVSGLSPGDKIVLLISRSGESAQFITGTVGQSPDTAQVPATAEEIKPAPIDTSARIFAPVGANSITSLALSADGRKVISGGYKSDTLQLWDISAGNEIAALTEDAAGPEKNTVSSIAFSPDGRYALSGGSDQTVKLWDLTTGKLANKFIGHTGWVLSVAFSPDGKYAASGSRDNTIRLWDVSSGKSVDTFTGHSDGVRSLVFSADGRYLLSGSYDKTIKLWDIASGRAIRTFTGHAWQIASVAFSQDGRQVLSRSGDRVIKVWDINSGSELRTFTADDVDASGVSTGSQGIVAGTFSVDGRHMLTTKMFGGTVKLWDVATGTGIKTFRGHLGQVPAVLFSPDMPRFVTGGNDGTVRLWDIESGRELAQFISLKDGEWIVLTPEGYFNASPNGYKYLNIRLGSKVYGIDQFYDVFYRPDIVAAKLKGEDVASLITLTIDDALQSPPPSISFTFVPQDTDQSRVNVCYKASSAGGGIGEVRLFQNGKLVKSDGFYREAVAKTTEEPIALAAQDSATIQRDLRNLKVVQNTASPIASSDKGSMFEECQELETIPGDNEISVAAFNAPNTIQSALETVRFKADRIPEEPHLYVLGVGIDHYRDASVDLHYAAKDASDFQAMMQEKAAGLYMPENIHVYGLADGQANKAGIEHAIAELSGKVKPWDSFILFVASHGVLLENQYYIVTAGYDGTMERGSMISSNEIVGMSKDIKSLSQLFIFDTCHAGGVDNLISGLYDARMSVMAKKMGLHIYASAGSTQTALDGYQGNGLFTHALLESMKQGEVTDINRDNQVSIVELGEQARQQTIAISRQLGDPQSPNIINFGRDNALFDVGK